MEATKNLSIDDSVVPVLGNSTKHETTVALEGLDDLFKWAAETMADAEEPRARRAREQRIRRQVMEAVQHVRGQEALVRATQENAYLHRRVTAVLQKLQDYTEENSALKQVMISQAAALDRIVSLEAENVRLKLLELDVDAVRVQCNGLLSALSKLKTDRDYLDELLCANEAENVRLASLLAECRSELERLHAKKWWQFWRR